jgi:hypothetical protein
VPSLQQAVARVLPAIEATLARLAAQPAHAREMEQAARTLGALTRTLRELNTLLRENPAPVVVEYDDMPEDLDEFRRQLAYRIEAFVASRPDDENVAEPPAEPATGSPGYSLSK